MNAFFVTAKINIVSIARVREKSLCSSAPVLLHQALDSYPILLNTGIAMVLYGLMDGEDCINRKNL
jgi:hypothetical protein